MERTVPGLSLRRIMPLLGLMYLIASIDRQNVSFAVLGRPARAMAAE